MTRAGSGPSPRGSAKVAAPAQLREHDERLERDPRRHLAASVAAVAEDDRDLAHGETALHRSLGQLDLEAVPVRADRVQVDRLEHLAAEAFEAAGQIAHPEAEHAARVGAAAAADDPPQQSPILDATARHV